MINTLQSDLILFVEFGPPSELAKHYVEGNLSNAFVIRVIVFCHISVKNIGNLSRLSFS